MSKALKRRLAALEAKLDDYIPVASPVHPLTNAAATLDAMREGRPFSPSRVPRPPPPVTNRQPHDGPGARVVERLEQLRAKLADDTELAAAFEANRKATIKAIDVENRAGERRERQKAKRQRRAERKAEAARMQAV
jgi:hypothetical protein